MMKQSWTEEIRRRLHDAELPVSADSWKRIEEQLHATPPKKMGWMGHRWVQWVAAAAILVGLFAAGRFAGEGVKATHPSTDTPHSLVAEVPATHHAEPSPAAKVPPREQPTVSTAPIRPTVSSDMNNSKSPIVSGTPNSADIPRPSKEADSQQTAPTTTEPPAKPDPTEQQTKEPTAAEPVTKSAPTVQTVSSSLRSGDLLAAAEPAPRPKRGISFALFGGSSGISTLSGGHKSAFAAMNNAFGVANPKYPFGDESNNEHIGEEDEEDGADTGSIVPPLTMSEQSFPSLQTMLYDNADFTHHQPWSVGLTLRKPLTQRLSIESGLIYTYLRSDLQVSRRTLHQQLHLIGVPLRLNWAFAQGDRFAFYLGAGGTVERCLYATLAGRQVTESRTYFSVGGALGAECRLTPTLALYFEPEASYALTKTRLRTIRNDEPFSLSLRVGVRFTLPHGER